MILINLLSLIILVIIAILAIKLIIKCSGLALKVALHLIFGWILLGLVNILPGIHVPVNIMTMLISGFGGVTGTIILALLYLF